MFEFLVNAQRKIYAILSADISSFAASGDWQALFAVLPFGIVFGVAHALMPGHSKSVLASYVLGSGLAPSRAMLASFALAATHISSAVILAVVANTLVTRTIVGAGRAPALEYISRILLAAIGVWLVMRAVRRQAHMHGEGAAVGAVAGLVPCPLTLFVMTYAVSKGVPEAGLAFSVAMLLGVGAVLCAVALATAYARDALGTLVRRYGQSMQAYSRIIEGCAGLALVFIACVELAR